MSRAEQEHEKEKMADVLSSDPRVYLAAERTFLAWIRTGLALTGFGFVVARFGLFLEEMHLANPALPIKSYGASFWFGTVMVLLGVAINVFSTWDHLHMVSAMNRGALRLDRPSKLGVAVAVIMSLAGLTVAAYLISIK